MDEDEDAFLYGGSASAPAEPLQASNPTLTSVSQPIPLEKSQPANGVLAQLEANAEEGEDQNAAQDEEEQRDEVEEEEEEEEESDDDIEIIMDQTPRSLDFRQQRAPTNRSASVTSTPVKGPPQPTLTTEYTPRERGTPIQKTPVTPQSQSQTQPFARRPTPVSSQIPTTPSSSEFPSHELPLADNGPDPSSLPPATAPPSHPSINPSQPGTLDGRSIFEVDMQALADKPWRRPGSDISDWFNYGFDELSWEAYCYRRREMGEMAGVLKANVLNFSGMPEEQLIALPPDVRTMVMTGATAMMSGGGPGPGMMGNPNMNMNPMMHPDMSGMMGPMGMGDIGMQMQVPGAGPMMQDPGAVNAGPSDQGMPDGFGVGVGGPMGMGLPMGPDFGMQEQHVMNQPAPFSGMEAAPGPGPGSGTPTPSAPRSGNTPVSFRGRGAGPPQGMAPRAVRGQFSGRGRGHVPQALPVRPASPLPPNVPTGPRNQNKYRDKDANAPAVEGLDYGGGSHREGSGVAPDEDGRSSSARKRRGSPAGEDRSSKRR